MKISKFQEVRKSEVSKSSNLIFFQSWWPFFKTFWGLCPTFLHCERSLGSSWLILEKSIFQKCVGGLGPSLEIWKYLKNDQLLREKWHGASASEQNQGCGHFNWSLNKTKLQKNIKAIDLIVPDLTREKLWLRDIFYINFSIRECGTFPFSWKNSHL